MRLTLRTLLAYLDDTLDPSEIKEIGQKVAESDAAQELIARIKQSTRRRRLTTPPEKGDGPRFDPNMVAEYLDSELDSEKVAELEKICLESDVHLAEVAACHQILTLVVGQPALVPPTARERMYGLVKGREAIPFRKAAAAPAADADADHEDSLLGGLPFGRGAGWLRWALPLVGVLLLGAIAVAIWNALPPGPSGPRVVAVDPKDKDKAPPADKDKAPPVDKDKDAPPPVDKDKDAAPPVDKDKDKAPPIDKDKAPPIDKDKAPPVDKDKDKAPPIDKDKAPPPPVADDGPAPPSKDRRVAGSYLITKETKPSILLARKGQEPWKRLADGNPVWTTDALVSLPGSMSELHLGDGGGAVVQLRGNLREFSIDPMMDFLAESAVVLHDPKGSFDVDLTLDRGRIYLSNQKKAGAVKVRLRFSKRADSPDPAETWDLTLQDPGTEVGVDLFRHYSRDVSWQDGEDPREELYFEVLNGKASLKIDYRLEYSNLAGPAGLALFFWDNKGPGAVGPQRVNGVPPIWSKVPPKEGAAAQMRAALDELNQRMVDPKRPVEATLMEGASLESPWARMLSIYCLGAVDAADKLITILGDEDQAHAADRNTAIFTLRRWIARDPRNGLRLYDPDPKNNPGLLKEKGYRSDDAHTVVELLHDYNVNLSRRPDTFQALANLLTNDRVAIRELAYWQLLHLSGGSKLPLPPYNAGLPADARAAIAGEWKKLIADGKLPPPVPTQPPPGPAPPGVIP